MTSKDYYAEILKMLENINNIAVLRKIYTFVKYLIA